MEAAERGGGDRVPGPDGGQAESQAAAAGEQSQAELFWFLAAGGARAGRALPSRRGAWNSGIVEGNVNRFKTLKHQMYGRANSSLLRQCVLHS